MTAAAPNTASSAVATQRPRSAGGDSLRRRIRRFYDRFAKADWPACHEMIDPRIRAKGRVDTSAYAAKMKKFVARHGAVRLWYVRLSMHPEGAGGQGDPRPFAFAYIVWQDHRDGFHMFRERWVSDGGQWYTRVVGLVPEAGRPA